MHAHERPAREACEIYVPMSVLASGATVVAQDCYPGSVPARAPVLASLGPQETTVKGLLTSL
jgi:hypothetical protein